MRDGDDWVVTGTKKWITNETFADYFTTPCHTDVRTLRCWTGAVCHFQQLQSRAVDGSCGEFLGAQRVNVEECLGWTNQRTGFKKPLHSQDVIRAKLALMIEHVEACQAWIENITHQMKMH